MSTYTEIQDSIWTWVKSETTLPDNQILWANKNGVRTVPLILLTITSFPLVGGESIVRTATPGEIEIYQDREYNISIEGYGESMVNYIMDIQKSLKKKSVIEYFVNEGISIRRTIDARDISALVDSTIEERWIFEVTFASSDVTTEQVGYWETVEITQN